MVLNLLSALRWKFSLLYPRKGGLRGEVPATPRRDRNLNLITGARPGPRWLRCLKSEIGDGEGARVYPIRGIPGS